MPQNPQPMPPRIPGQPGAGPESPSPAVTGGSTRREFIKRIIASGAVASSASFMVGGLAGCMGGGDNGTTVLPLPPC